MITGEWFQVGLILLLVIVVTYAAGRTHQWMRSGIERDNAYREGYDTATSSLFSLATKVSKKLTETAELPAPKAQPPVALEQRRKLRPSPPATPSPQQIIAEREKKRGPRHAA